jgi:hypothetical protein
LLEVKLPRKRKWEVFPDLHPDLTAFRKRKPVGRRQRQVTAGLLLSGSEGLTRAGCELETRNIQVEVRVGFDDALGMGRVFCS